MAYTVPVHGLEDGNVSDGKETEVELHQVRQKLRGKEYQHWSRTYQY